jgi:fructose-1,6-bisphosphatase I / sedoheptulose-1,7-bisphosphatase
VTSATTTLEGFVASAGHGEVGACAALLDLAAGVRAIAAVLPRAAVAGAIDAPRGENVQGERQTEMDLVANELLIDACIRSGQIAAVVSEEMTEPHYVMGRGATGPLLLAMDPLDGTANLGVNVTVGTIFSILRRPVGVPLGAEAFLQPGASQVCAGYALYGPCTMLVLAAGGEVNGFTLDVVRGQFVLTQPGIRIPAEGREYAVNASNARRWDPPVRRYVEECVLGSAGPRGVDFNTRWVGSMVADVHRVLLRGGAFLHPRDPRTPERPAKLRLLYEAAPMALIVEQAGGAASTGRTRLLDVVPRSLHERVPVLLGSRREVERLVAYHAAEDGEDRPYQSPLFNVRSLLRGS